MLYDDSDETTPAGWVAKTSVVAGTAAHAALKKKKQSSKAEYFINEALHEMMQAAKKNPRAGTGKKR